ncbi:hypothetical protein C8F01DRAFT_1256388 [Mycena amicta]|nr:hypothetical protein C8F01DRAFT_1256388 [Mycena amicta]
MPPRDHSRILKRRPGFPQVPFNGPPPKPPHIRANPQDWQNGSWSMNPAFNASQWSLSSASAWMPGQAWGQRQAAEWQAHQQQMAAAAAYNPFKRNPRPPSAEYLATKLSENPLGLTNMIPRETLFGPRNGWDSCTDAVAPPIYARPSQTRDMSDPIPQSTSRTPIRHSSEPPAERRSSTDERPRQYSRELQPTFSTNIVRTPDHYKTRSSSVGPSPPPQPIYGSPGGRTASRLGRFRVVQSYGTFELLQPHTTRTRFRDIRHYQHRRSVLPPTSTSMTGVSSFVDEPSTLLSPLVGIAADPQTRAATAGRNREIVDLGHTSPAPSGPATSPPLANMFAMPPQMNVYQTARVSPPSQPNEQQYQPQNLTPPNPQSLTPPHNPNPSSSLTPPHITPPRINSHSAFATPPSSTPSYSTPPHHQHQQHNLHNPLPAPPQEPLSRDPDLRLPVQRPAPERWRARTILTMDGYIVYAPPNCAYPEELSDYPAETVGYRDHLGTELMYMDRPELPESLPRHGQPPRQPYEKFVVYDYLQ